ncbi:MAG: ABC1 kinase family protein, partial [Planctomycetota bacterium]
MPSPFIIGRTIRGTRRARHILTVLVGYGFHSVIEDLNLDTLMLKGRKLVGVAKTDAHVSREPTPVRLRKAMEELGPTFVKLGQVLSTRPDLVPPGWAEEFEKLQDDVPPAGFEAVREQLDREFPDGFDEIVRSIEHEPMAAASIAQVHRAVLADGTHVVLKILRPGIRQLVESDLDILRVIADFVEEHFVNLGYSPLEVVDQFKKELERELDLVQEGRSTERLGGAFAEDENVQFARVFWQATTSGVLALEEVEGTPLSKLDPETLAPGELEQIVANGTDAVFRQCLEIGFFHADPHPGNIFSIGGGRICFLDCGMTGHVEPDTAELLADLVHGVIEGD